MDELVIVELLQPVTQAFGGLHNPGERAAFPDAVARDLIYRGMAKAVVLSRSVDAPPVDKRLLGPPQRKQKAR